MVIDIKIALFLNRCLNYYIRKRKQKAKSSEEETWSNLFKENDSFLHTIEGDISIKLYRDSILSRLIYQGFETKEILFLQRYLKQGNVFLDIGANIGLFSLVASPIVGDSGRVFAFEPTPTTYLRLLENIDLNSFTNITVINSALSNKNGSQDFYVSTDGHDAWNSMVPLEEIGPCNSISVNVIRLDDYISENVKGKVDLVKIDVEGWEKFVMEGAVELLTDPHPPVFLVEFTETNAFAAGYYCGEIYDLMTSYGYQWFSYNEAENKIIPEKKQLHYPWVNLLAVKDPNDCTLRMAK